MECFSDDGALDEAMLVLLATPRLRATAMTLGIAIVARIGAYSSAGVNRSVSCRRGQVTPPGDDGAPHMADGSGD